MPGSLSTGGMLALLGVYVLAMVALTRRWAGRVDAEGFIVADRDVPPGAGTASMSATWIWAASMYAAATAAFTYGPSGAFHYAFWGGLALLFVWWYGQRVRRLAPNGHTFSEFVRARHGRLSQGVMGLEGYLNSQYSLVVNFTAAAALLSLFSPLSYTVALVLVALVVVGYSTVSGIRASVVTDVVQMGAILILTAVIVPLVVLGAGGPRVLATGLAGLGPRGSFLSMEAFLGQGAPMMALILAYAFANPTVWQRIWAMRERDLRRVYMTSGVVYMSAVFAVGTLGVVALATGLQPVDGDLNTLVPLVTSRYLPSVLAAPVVLLVLAAVTSTSDSDLAALSSIAMTDVWHGYVSPSASDRQLLLVGRLSMVVVAGLAVAVGLLRIDILTLILFYGMIRAASVFPIAASIVWDRVSDLGFSTGVIAGIIAGTAARLWSIPGADGTSTLSRNLAVGGLFILVASVGAGGMAGCLAFPFGRPRVAVALGLVTAVAVLGVQLAALPGLLTYFNLLSTLTALGVGMLVCTGVSLATRRSFEWYELDRRVQPLTGQVS